MACGYDVRHPGAGLLHTGSGARERSGARPISRCPSPESRYTWNFTPDKAEFRRTSEPCDTFTEIAVSAEDDAEVRRITLVNISRKLCRLELTSYAELALAPHRTDRAHPAFNKLFIETEWLPHCEALLARRRLRAPDDRPIWAAHLMVAESPSAEPPEFETDRARFLGRGRTLENPEAIRARPNEQRRRRARSDLQSAPAGHDQSRTDAFSFPLVTVMAESREAVIGLAERYSEFRVSIARL